ncbi:MAG: hypothetical protein LBQ93_08670 [Treponema sp.]|jgi:hypothetical protein|nr:hypothetical protein [Treponema sp.]
MDKRIIFTGVLTIIGISSFFIGLKPFGPVLSLLDRYSKIETVVEVEPEPEPEPEPEVKIRKSIQISLSDKSEQILTVLADLKTVQGAVNVLQSVDAKVVFVAVEPLESLSPFNKTLGRISGLCLFIYGILIFEKTLLLVFVSIVLMILIPVCAMIAISTIWKSKNKAIKMHIVVVVSALISLVIFFSLPISLWVSTLLEEKVFSENVNSLVSSIDESKTNAVKMENELRSLRRVGTSITNYVPTAKDISNAVIRDSINYLIFFLILYIIIPVFAVFGLYKITRYCLKMIL